MFPFGVKGFFIVFTSTVILYSTSATASEPRIFCDDLAKSDIDGVIRGFEELNMPRCFEAYIPSTGTLMLEAIVAPSARAEPRLDFLGRVCDQPQSIENDFRYRQRTADSLLIEIHHPGRHVFCIKAQEAGQVLGPFMLFNSFAANPAELEEDPDEDEPDLDPWSPPEDSTWGIQDICRRRQTDDHGDTRGCATPLAREASGRIHNSWGDDGDYFSFPVSELATLRIETAGSTDTRGGLYDLNGYRLASDDDSGEGSNFLIVKTLSPGRYFIRVTGSHGAEGEYRLISNILEAGDRTRD